MNGCVECSDVYIKLLTQYSPVMNGCVECSVVYIKLLTQYSPVMIK